MAQGQKIRNGIPVQEPRQRGIALVYTIFLTMILILLISTSAMYTISSLHAGRHELTKSADAKNIALTGLQMAHLWFTQQAVQPVHQTPVATPAPAWPDGAFLPLYNTDPTVSATDDKNCVAPGTSCSGMVHDVLISQDNKLWGHYVVPRQSSNNEPTAGGSAANDNPFAVRDVSSIRTSQGKGTGYDWRLTSYGYVYIRADMTQGNDGVFTIPYNQAPNKVIDQTVAQMEIQRLAINTPAAAITYDTGALSVDGRSQILNTNGGAAVIYGNTASAPTGVTANPGSNIQGTQQSVKNAGLSLTPQALFMVNQPDLAGMADQSVTQVSQLIYPLPTMGIIFINGNATFTTGQPLTGGGILYVTGNLTIQQDSNSSFSGVIYVGGNFALQGANYVSGTVVVRGNSTLSSTADVAEIDYSSSIIQILQTRLGTYRANNLSMKLFPI